MAPSGRAERASPAPGVEPGDGRPGVEEPDASQPVALEARGLVKRYAGRSALAGVGLEVRRGELVACIGPNGAGKTTLLSILAGVQQADDGTVDRPTGRVGWVPQQPALYGKLTAAENLSLFARLEGVDDVEATVARMLDHTGLTERATDLVSALSAGNRQRLNVAIGLLSAPEVLLLDEPTAALDPRQRQSLWRFILDLAREGTSVVYSTHDVTEAERHADRVLVLADGEALFWGSLAGLWNAVGASPDVSPPGPRAGDFEAAFVSFLRERGH